MNELVKTLVGDCVSTLASSRGSTFASLLITAGEATSGATSAGMYSFISDTPQPDLWVMDLECSTKPDNKPMLDRASLIVCVASKVSPGLCRCSSRSSNSSCPTVLRVSAS